MDSILVFIGGGMVSFALFDADDALFFWIGAFLLYLGLK